MSCPELASTLVEVQSDLATVKRVIDDNQSDNGAKAAASYVFTPLLLTMKDVPPAKEKYQELDERRERITRISQARECK